MKPVRVLLVDDHSVVRQGLRAILESDEDFIVVGEAADGPTALHLATTLTPDVVLLDIKLAGSDGIVVCRQIIENNPQIAVLILSAYIDKSLVNACLQSGARGYLLKDAEDLRLREHILSVLQGYAALDPRVAGILTDYVCQQPRSGNALNWRDLEILRLISQGLTNREISVQLNLSENTIKGYVKDIISRMGVHNRIEAVLVAKERGLL